MEDHNDQPTNEGMIVPGTGEDGRWFSHEIASETTVAQLVEYYSRFDDIEQIRLDVDSANISQLVAHILFRTTQGPKKISTEKNVPKLVVGPQNQSAETSNTVYVDGLTPEITSNDLRQCFEKYGEIRNVRRPLNHITCQPEPYCFIEFRSKEVVHAVLTAYIHAIGNVHVTAKPAKARCKSTKRDRVLRSPNVFPQPAKRFGSISTQQSYTFSHQGIAQVGHQSFAHQYYSGSTVAPQQHAPLYYTGNPLTAAGYQPGMLPEFRLFNVFQTPM